jgi:PAS domain S-box-containing protein
MSDPAESRLQRLAALVPGVLYQLQRWPDGRMAMPFATEGLRDVFDVEPAAVRDDATPLFQRAHAEDLPRLLRSIEDSARDLSPWECEYRVHRADGRLQWHHGRAMPEPQADGSILWHGHITPIDERKAAEQALRRSEESFRHFFEAGLVGMTIAEPDLRWRSVNGRMCELLGCTREQILALTWADFTHPDDLAEDQANYARMERGEIDGYVMDKRYVRADGSVLECRLAVRCERTPEGALQRVFAIVEDISEARAAERALQQQRERLEQEVAQRTQELVAARDAAQQASRAKTEFLSSMSHELRTPLNAILGFTQLIELDRDLGERSRGHLREVMRAGRHLLRLINEVLDLAQVESGRLALSPEALRLSELLEDAAALTDPMARPRGLKLYRDVPDDLVVQADRMRLKQVLLNLLSNAAKYGRPGSRVEVRAQRLPGGERVRLTVSDQGPGIAPERLDQLFQPFNRLGAERGSVEGTGIGLALSRRLMELMSGSIGVESRPGEGSDFWIELPLTQLAAPPPPTEGPPAVAGWPGGPETLVLYVEDNPANLALVEQILARHGGVRLISADDGPRGLALAREHRPALILMDIHLPVMDGYEVLARLRADESTRGIPVVALTAQAMPQDARRAIQAGFDEYVSKPIDVPVFDTLLRRFLHPPPA